MLLFKRRGTAGRVTAFHEVPLRPLFFLYNGRHQTPSWDWGSMVGLNF